MGRAASDADELACEVEELAVRWAILVIRLAAAQGVVQGRYMQSLEAAPLLLYL